MQGLVRWKGKQKRTFCHARAFRTRECDGGGATGERQQHTDRGGRPNGRMAEAVERVREGEELTRRDRRESEQCNALRNHAVCVCVVRALH